LEIKLDKLDEAEGVGRAYGFSVLSVASECLTWRQALSNLDIVTLLIMGTQQEGRGIYGTS